MFRRNAFGELVQCSPRLRFMAPKPDPAGGGGGTDTVELDGEKFAFPPETAVKDMTPEQAAEYWRHEAKKQQKKGPKKPADYDQLQADAAELARIRAEQTPEEERKRQQELEDARRDGENLGAQRYLKDAIIGRVQAITGLDEDALSDTLAAIDPTYFVDDEGNLDAEKINKFATPLGKGGGSGGGSGSDPVREAQSRQRPAGAPGDGLSMRERREAAAAAMTKKKSTNT
jgi:hypothetical protein